MLKQINIFYVSTTHQRILPLELLDKFILNRKVNEQIIIIFITALVKVSQYPREIGPIGCGERKTERETETLIIRNWLM